MTTWQTRSQWLAAEMGGEPPGPGLQVTGTEPPHLCQGLTLSPRPWFCVSLVSQQNIHSKYSDLSQLSQCFKVGSIPEATPQGRECPPRPAEAGGEAYKRRDVINSTAVGFQDALPTIPTWGAEQVSAKQRACGVFHCDGGDAPSLHWKALCPMGQIQASLKEAQIHVPFWCLRVELSNRKVGTHPSHNKITENDRG